MKLLDKLKNVFFEEEYVEVEEKEPRKPKKVIAKKIDTNKIEIKEPKEEVILDKKEDSIVEEDLLKSESKFKFPEILDDDFTSLPKKESKPLSTYYDKKENCSYNHDKIDNSNYGLYEKKEEKKMFRPSPIISPIYGILDKNYTKNDIVVKKEIHISGSNGHIKTNLDEVREKAYGRSSDKTKEIVNDINEIIEDVQQSSTLYDMNIDTKPVVDKITVGDAEEYFADLGLEYNVDYKDKTKEKSVGRRSNKENTSDEDTIINYDEDTLEHSLFDIIDSMYEEKE